MLETLAASALWTSGKSVTSSSRTWIGSPASVTSLLVSSTFTQLWRHQVLRWRHQINL